MTGVREVAHIVVELVAGAVEEEVVPADGPGPKMLGLGTTLLEDVVVAGCALVRPRWCWSRPHEAGGHAPASASSLSAPVVRADHRDGPSPDTRNKGATLLGDRREVDLGRCRRGRSLGRQHGLRDEGLSLELLVDGRGRRRHNRWSGSRGWRGRRSGCKEGEVRRRPGPCWYAPW